MSNDPSDLLEDDFRKFQQYRGKGMDTSIPAMLELGFGAVTLLIGFVWLVSLYWVPDPIDGQVWMQAGMLGLLIFGGPAGLIFMLRRGGSEVLMAMVREFAR